MPAAETVLALAALVALVPVAAGFGGAGAFESGREATATVIPQTRARVFVGGDDAADADDAGADALAEKADASALETKDPSPSFAVYRMLGNDMWPLQGVGQMRRNSVFAARHEAAPPPDVPVFWVVNRVVDAAEREKLTSALAAEKNVSAGSLLFASPPLRDAKCLFASDASSLTDLPNNANATTTAKRTDDWERAVTFAQAQNAVRNAAVAHARERGYDWAVPLDGNQFLPSDFYALLRAALREADADGHVAALIPMLRVREEQTGEAYHSRADAASVAVRHMREDGKFAVSEPQVALHARKAEALGFRFDPSSAYGAGNKAGLVRQLCPAKSPSAKPPAGGLAEAPARARCCELVDMKRRQQGDPYYYGAELDLSRVAAKTKISGAGRNLPAGPEKNATDAESSRSELRRVTLRAASRLFEKCAVSVRLFNYAPEDGPSQLKIATSVLTRAATRDEAAAAFREKLGAYLARTPEPEPETCAALDATRATLVARDPEADSSGETKKSFRVSEETEEMSVPSSEQKPPRFDPNPSAFLFGVASFGAGALVAARRLAASRRRRGKPPPLPR